MTDKKREIILSGVLLAGSLALIFYIIPNYIDLEGKFEFASLSPAFFPDLAAWIIAGLAGFYLVATALSRKTQATGKLDETWLNPGEELNAYRCALVIIVYLMALKYVGFLIATVLVLAILLVLKNERRPLRVALISSLVTIGVYLFFFFVMEVHLPRGLVFE